MTGAAKQTMPDLNSDIECKHYSREDNAATKSVSKQNENKEAYTRGRNNNSCDNSTGNALHANNISSNRIMPQQHHFHNKN
eukprot:scaffold155574_cov36-Prasinocladus_malaysianus.AAC.2